MMRGTSADAMDVMDEPDPPPPYCSPAYDTFGDEFGRTVTCLYVATTGSDDTGTGAPDAPYATIRIRPALGRTGRWAPTRSRSLAGRTTERVELVSGVSIFGGFDATADWAPDPDRGHDDSRAPRSSATGSRRCTRPESWNPTVLEDLTIRANAPEMAGPGLNIVGVSVENSQPVESDGLLLRDVTVRAGDATRRCRRSRG